jgi:1,2-diacylglycerol 3-beta-glucosyltransferase
MIISAFELFIISFGLTYYLATVGMGVVIMRGYGWRGRHARCGGGVADIVRSPAGSPAYGQHRARSRADERGFTLAGRAARSEQLLVRAADELALRAAVVAQPEGFVTYFLVPCLNEELVIGQTTRALLADRRARVVIVDDASDDATGEIAAAIDASRVIVVRRELPEGRLGKGPALNAGLAAILHHAANSQVGASRIIVCVMDADGELSPHALDEVLPLFCDGRVGGVQLPVRIRNTGSLLTTLQDLEFWGVAAIGQIGRNATGTVSLGGNGQFTRLTALLDLGRDPWRARLTEDLDLALALATAGWRLMSTPRAYVSQQGVPGLRALIRQRSRWYQGHMEAAEWFRQLWTSRRLSHLGMLEISLYLMVPWVLVLPWSIFFNYNLVVMAGWLFGWSAAPPIGSDPAEQITSFVALYLLSFTPIWSAGYLYYKQLRSGGLLRAFLVGHLLLAGSYITYIACWRALYGRITGAHGWHKTGRLDERPTGPASAPTSTVATPTCGVSEVSDHLELVRR